MARREDDRNGGRGGSSGYGSGSGSSGTSVPLAGGLGPRKSMARGGIAAPQGGLSAGPAKPYDGSDTVGGLGANRGVTMAGLAAQALKDREAEKERNKYQFEGGVDNSAAEAARKEIMAQHEASLAGRQEDANVQGAMMQRQMQARGGRMGLSGPASLAVSAMGQINQNNMMNQAETQWNSEKTNLMNQQLGQRTEEDRYNRELERASGEAYGSMDEDALGKLAAGGDKAAEEAYRLKKGYSEEEWALYREQILGKLQGEKFTWGQAPSSTPSWTPSTSNPNNNPGGPGSNRSRK